MRRIVRFETRKNRLSRRRIGSRAVASQRADIRPGILLGVRKLCRERAAFEEALDEGELVLRARRSGRRHQLGERELQTMQRTRRRALMASERGFDERAGFGVRRGGSGGRAHGPVSWAIQGPVFKLTSSASRFGRGSPRGERSRAAESRTSTHPGRFGCCRVPTPRLSRARVRRPTDR